MSSPHNVLLDPTIDDKTWRVAVGMTLVDLVKQVNHNHKESNVEFRTLKDEIKNEIKESFASCGIDVIKKVLFGNGDPEAGLVTKHATLKREVKIRGSLWGIVGGSGIGSIIVALYFLLRGHV